jgi:type II secretory pathway component GspD/PulD (secretin)
MPQNQRLLYHLLLTGLCLAGYAGAPLMGQSNPAWQPLRPGVRGAISHPREPAPTPSIYPIIREPAPEGRQREASNNRGPGWVDLGHGTRIKLADNQNNKENRLSPEVLETIRQLKEQPTEPRFQLQAPITGATPNTLQSPAQAATPRNSDNGSNSRDKQALDSYLRLPREKNIKITSLDFRQTSVADALRSLSHLISINLMLSQGISGEVTILFNDVTIEEAFNTLLSAYNLTFAWEGSILRIFNKSEAPRITRMFPIQHTNAAEIKTIVDRMLSDEGSCEVDARTNSLMITAAAAKLAEIAELLPQVDVKESTVDVSSRPVTEVYYLNYADATSLEQPIKMLSTAVQIQAFSSSQASQAGAAGGATGGRMDMMIITDTQNNLNRIRELIDKLDMPPIQVTIDAHIYEIDKNEEERLGINWQKSIPVPGATGNLFDISISPEESDAGGTGVFRFGSLDTNQFRALLAMLKTHSFAKVLSNPVITTLNNRQANITVGQAIPYVSASQVNAETGQVTNTIQQVNADISLIVTPSVTGNDEVFLDIQPTISSVLGFTDLGGNSTPNLSSRSAQTQVICKNNHTIVIGGMIKTDKSSSISKVPFLGDLPGIGKFFQRKTNRETRTELIIFITPHIVHREANRMARPANGNNAYGAPRLTLQP